MESRQVAYQGSGDVIVLPDGLDRREETEHQKATDDDQFRPVAKDHREESSRLQISIINRLASSILQAYLSNKVRDPRGKP